MEQLEAAGQVSRAKAELLDSEVTNTALSLSASSVVWAMAALSALSLSVSSVWSMAALGSLLRLSGQWLPFL